MLAVVFVSCFMFGFSLGLGPISWMYMADILPDVGVAMASAFSWLAGGGVGIGFE